MDNNQINVNARLEREYFGYNLFDQVDNVRIQTWNRTMTFFNIWKDKSRATAIDYLVQLGREGKKAVSDMIEEMKVKGHTKLHKEVWDTNEY